MNGPFDALFLYILPQCFSHCCLKAVMKIDGADRYGICHILKGQIFGQMGMDIAACAFYKNGVAGAFAPAFCIPVHRVDQLQNQALQKDLVFGGGMEAANQFGKNGQIRFRLIDFQKIRDAQKGVVQNDAVQGNVKKVAFKRKFCVPDLSGLCANDRIWGNRHGVTVNIRDPPTFHGQFDFKYRCFSVLADGSVFDCNLGVINACGDNFR